MFDIFIQKIPILAQNSDPLYKKMVFFPNFCNVSYIYPEHSYIPLLAEKHQSLFI